jgi:hypothetical protein
MQYVLRVTQTGGRWRFTGDACRRKLYFWKKRFRVIKAGLTLVFCPVNEQEIAVRCFECYTCDPEELVRILKAHKTVSVAMGSTGVYRIPLFLLLQESGMEVCSVNAGHVKNVTGRKDDEGDAEWIQKLHRCGLLSASFQPDGFIRELRTVVRTRDTFVKSDTDVLNCIQAAPDR